MVNVCPQPWIPHVQNLHVSPPPPNGLENLNVSSLINHEKATWRMEIIDQLRNEEDKLDIQSTPFKDVQPLISIQPAIQSFNDGVMQGMTTLYQTPIVLNLFLLYGISHSKVDTSATLTLQFSQARGSMVLEFA
ncbi:hypothetical protein JHK85_001211 [Glycine max]|nr:hypothetical protein JHK85_001211 [Glycine max]KAG5088568.1 hypothetical protein JHK86_001180 [Glycine max]